MPDSRSTRQSDMFQIAICLLKFAQKLQTDLSEAKSTLRATWGSHLQMAIL